VRAILGGLNRYPQSLMLWTGLGTALATHDGNVVSPPALFAFRQAIRIAPEHPAPLFFLGLAYIRANDYPAARQAWAKALALCPERASYRRDIAVRLALLDRLLASQPQRQPQR
jgi:cytochrome c-type biogenesis protein CcmH/NrfG